MHPVSRYRILARQSLHLLRHRGLLVVIIVLPIALILAPHLLQRSYAAGVVGDGTPGSCTEAALDAALAGGGTISFNCGADPHVIVLSSTKTIADGMSVTLDGGTLITLSGYDAVQVFLVEEGGSLSLEQIALSHGNAGIEAGGAIANRGGVVTVNRSYIVNSRAGDGGGIANVDGGVLNVTDSTISGHISSGSGGGIHTNSGTTTVQNSTIADNTALEGNGGGFSYYLWSAELGGPLTIESSTILNNAADLGGAISANGGEGTPEIRVTNSTFVGNQANNSGAIYNGNTLATVTNSTFVDNHASEYVSGIFNSGSESTLFLLNSILSNDPDSPGGNCANSDGTFSDQGGNIQFPEATCGDTIPTLDPLLGPLTDHGGPTQTMAPGEGSPAIDAGEQNQCPAVDQRGQPRPADGDGDGTAQCDSGAYERQPGEQPPEADNVVGDGTPASCTEAALREAVARSGTITFDCGDMPHTIPVADDIVIAHDTVLDGGGDKQGGLITISGENATRVFRTENHVHFRVENLTIANGREPGADGSGGGIRTGWRSTLTVINAIFENNDGTAGNQERGGGAIATESENIVIVRDSLFKNNRGANGGAINNLLSELTIENSVFLNNDSSFGASSAGHGAGGAVYTDGASKHDGTTSGTIAIRSSTFVGNKSSGEGGAAFTWIYPPDQVIIEKTTFDGNLVVPDEQGNALGGGLRHGNGDLFISDTTFSGNVARKQGGGFWTDGIRPGVLTNVTFANNQAIEDETTGEGGLGGAIAGEGNFSCINCTIANNEAGNQAGAIFGGGDITLKNTVIAYNASGNQWGLHQGCDQYMIDEGGNIQFPGEDESDPKNQLCAGGALIADPLLQDLADNGGPTLTMAPEATSPAVDAGLNDGCPATDQRGVARPFDGDGDGVARCDSGAYEVDTFVARVPLERVALEGETEGRAGLRYDFSAAIVPADATQPVSYTWEATGQPTQTGESAEATYTWTVSGTGRITVTAANRVGAPVSDTHEIALLAADEVGMSRAFTITHGVTNTLTFTDTTTGALLVSTEIPSDAIPVDLSGLRYTDLEGVPLHAVAGFAPARRAFLLEALGRDGQPLENVVFDPPLSLSVSYSQREVAGLDVSRLVLFRWDEGGQRWHDAAATCAAPSDYRRGGHSFVLEVCRLSEFVVGEGVLALYLPMVGR